jgi:lactate racemase
MNAAWSTTAEMRCGSGTIRLQLPAGSHVYDAAAPNAVAADVDTVMKAVRQPVAGPSLREALRVRRAGPVAVVVSDITRPIPYERFLGELLAEVESAGVAPDRVVIVVATGMHRPSTPQERGAMFGAAVCRRYAIVDHVAEAAETLAELAGQSWSGAKVRLNRQFVEAGFRLVTGLVEPHFMAGFSGGRKAVCPGLAGLDTVRQFHGYRFLADSAARNANLEGNPLHKEALSVARLAGVDFALNLVLDSQRRVAAAFAGALEESHDAACALVLRHSCPAVVEPADIVVTSCGGAPLDATFYQCVKGLVSCLPAVRHDGTIVALAGCAEGAGGDEYRTTMRRFAGDWRGFLKHVATSATFVKDQWQAQMHCRALEKVGVANLHFVTDGLDDQALESLWVTGHAVHPGEVQTRAQTLLRSLWRPGMKLAAIAEGPYCAVR